MHFLKKKKQKTQKAKALFGCAEKGKVFRFQPSCRTQFHSNKKQIHSIMCVVSHQTLTINYTESNSLNQIILNRDETQ